MENLDKKYAELLIGTGVNVQKGQTLMISADPIHHEFVNVLVETAYQKGARKVIVKFASESLSRLHYLYQDLEDLVEVPQWTIDEHDDYLSQDLCKLALRSPNPGVMKDVDSSKIAATTQSLGNALARFQNYSMSSEGQWLVCAYPTLVWAQAAFPDLEPQKGYEKLYEYILKACRVSESNNPEEEWESHNAVLAGQNAALNKHDFEKVHFTNGLGTDITVGLVPGHIWSGGKKPSQKGVMFNANIPTEESFTTPDRFNVNGIVYNTLPLNNNGRLIDGFWLKFVDGVVVDYDAKEGKDALQSLLKMDENSNRIGEIALVSKTSPIYQMNTLFYNTLFDENASCHIALGKGYPLIEGGPKMSRDELLKRGVNQSLIHVDFMFGSDDMNAVGIKSDGTEVSVIKDGLIVIA